MKYIIILMSAAILSACEAPRLKVSCYKNNALVYTEMRTEIWIYQGGDRSLGNKCVIEEIP